MLGERRLPYRTCVDRGGGSETPFSERFGSTATLLAVHVRCGAGAGGPGERCHDKCWGG